MPRNRKIKQRKWLPDPKFNNQLITRFMNVIMQHGKKSTAEKIVYGAFDEIRKKTKDDPEKVFMTALENVKPKLEVKSRRVGGATYQVPIEVHEERRVALSMRWLVGYARKRPGKTMRDKLANELIEAAHKRGAAVKKREDVHKMAEANKAFAHYRW